MQEFTIAFAFEVSGSTVPLNASLDITDSNVISLAAGPAQIQPSNSPCIPALSYLNVKENGINLEAGPNPSAQSQGLEVIVAVVPSQATLSLDFSYQNVIVRGYYQFMGYNRIELQPGTTVVSFPS